MPSSSRPVLRAAAQGTVPEASAADLVASCAIGRGEVADSLNRGGLRAHRERDYGRAVRLWTLALEVTAPAVSVPVTQTTVTTGNTGDPDSDAQIVTDRVVSRVVCTAADDLWTCEARQTSRRCEGSHGAPRWYVRSICN